jgi:hypothetical protein
LVEGQRVSCFPVRVENCQVIVDLT